MIYCMLKLIRTRRCRVHLWENSLNSQQCQSSCGHSARKHKQEGCLYRAKGSGWQLTAEERVERVPPKKNTIAKHQEVYKMNKFGNPDFLHNSLARPEETLCNETLQVVARSVHNNRCQAKAWTRDSVGGLVYTPLLPANQEELEQRISTALETVSQYILQHV